MALRAFVAISACFPAFWLLFGQGFVSSVPLKGLMDVPVYK